MRAFSHAYKRYALALLTLVYTLNCVDRGLIGLLLQPIKEDLGLSDTQLGFLTGMAFGVFYATMGLPIARWADRGNRATITSMAIALWGVTVMSCLFVANFSQLVVARIAAAIGESGGMPPTYSLVGDYFPGSAERTRAMATYMLASPLSVLVSYMVGGWLNERYGWRATFFLLGIPGLLLAILVKLTIVEPRQTKNQKLGLQQRSPSLTEVFRTLWHQRSLRHLTVAIILLWMIGHGLNPWYAAFMMRSHGMGTSEVGVWLGAIFCGGGLIGIWLSGYVIARWFSHNERGQMCLSAIVIALLVPCYVIFLLVPHKHQALIALVPVMAAFNFFLGPTFALMQRLVIDEMRATTLAVIMLLANLIGMGIGPQIVGLLSDLFRPTLGMDSLRYAMLTMSLIAMWAAYHFWQVGNFVAQDISAAGGRAQLARNQVGVGHT